MTEPEYPVVIIDTDGYPYAIPSEAFLAGWVEPLTVEETALVLDRRAREWRFELTSPGYRLVLTDLPTLSVVPGISAALARYEDHLDGVTVELLRHLLDTAQQGDERS